jgi:molecular chaperone DnaK
MPSPPPGSSSPVSAAAEDDDDEDLVTIATGVTALMAEQEKARAMPEATQPAARAPARLAPPPIPPAKGTTLRLGGAPPPPAPTPAAGSPPATSPRDVASTLPHPVSFEEVLRAERQGPARASEPASEKAVPAAAPPPILVDVTPRALVVETVGGWCDVVVQRNAKIPCERTRAFTTSSDGQSVVHVRVAQGEDPTFQQNTFLGQVELSGLRPAPRGQVTIQVRFEVDESSTLKVHATDVSTGREAHATLQLVAIAGHESVEQMRVRHAGTRVN